ncbi:MAG: hypothetical protein AAGG45_07785 [Pseudomonadota bacterium]
MSDYRWYPYTLKQGAIWLFQGFAVPILIFVGTILFTTLWAWVASDEYDFEKAYDLGKNVALIGFLLSFGSFGLSVLFQQELSWKTCFRVCGFIVAIACLLTLVTIMVE